MQDRIQDRIQDLLQGRAWITNFDHARVGLGQAILSLSLVVGVFALGIASAQTETETESVAGLAFPLLSEEAETLSPQKFRHQLQVRAAAQGGLRESTSRQERLSWRVEQSLSSHQIGVWIPYMEPMDQASGIGDVELLWRFVRTAPHSTNVTQVVWARIMTPSGDARRSRGWESWGGRGGIAQRWNFSRSEFQLQAEITHVLAGRSREGQEASFQVGQLAGRAVFALDENWALQLEVLALEDVEVLDSISLRRTPIRSLSWLGIVSFEETSGLEGARLALGLQQNWRSPFTSAQGSDLSIVLAFRTLQTRSTTTSVSAN